MLPKDPGLPIKLEYIYRAKTVGEILSDNRIKIKVYGLHDELADAQCPIAEVAWDIFGAADGYGIASKVEKNCDVWVFFDGGNIDSPVLFAQATNVTKNNAYDIANNYRIKVKENLEIKSDKNITIESGGKIMILSDGTILIN